MSEVNAKDLTTKTTPASTDSMLLFGTTSNEGAKITVDNLADNILGRLTTKTFANQVGGSSAATLLAQLSTLNSNMTTTEITSQVTIDQTIPSSGGNIKVYQCGKIVIVAVWGVSFSLTSNSSTSFITGLPHAVCSATARLAGAGYDTVTSYGNMYFSSGGTTLRISLVAGANNKALYGSLVYIAR